MRMNAGIIEGGNVQKSKQPFSIDRVSSDPIINTVPLIVNALQKSMSFNAFQLS